MYATGHGRLVVPARAFAIVAETAVQTAERYHNLKSPKRQYSPTTRLTLALASSFSSVRPRRRRDGDFEFDFSFAGELTDHSDAVLDAVSVYADSEMSYETEELCFRHAWRNGAFAALLGPGVATPGATAQGQAA
jgi:hypothetical protein